ncbi:MAG: hypothetical protein HFI74_13265 [Lachnospiraceae bacterium]|jgi:hypothetical protein|nr:hypothetical protein [Lachnospiraceae bacterium]
MRILIKTENAAKAAKDVRLSLSEAVKVCIKKKEGVALGQFITCEGNSQTHTPFYCELDEEQAEFIAGSEFLGTITTMADMGEMIEIIKEDDNCIEVSCGGSNVFLPLKKSMKLLQMKEDAETVTVKMDVVEFKNAILYGGYCPSKDNALGLKNTIELKFDFGGEEIQGAEQVLHVQTTDS